MTLDADAFLGCVIRAKIKNRWRILLAVRLHEQISNGPSWANFKQIDDAKKFYSKLPIDAISIVSVKPNPSGGVLINDLYNIYLTKNGDTTTVLQAIKDGYLPNIMDTSLESEGYLHNPKPK